MSEVKPWKNRKTQEEIRQIMNNNSPQHPKNVQVDLTHTNKDPKLDVQTTNSDREDQLNMLWDCFHPYDKEKTYAKWLELINTSIQKAKVDILAKIGEPRLGDFNINYPSYEDVIKTITWYKNRIAELEAGLQGEALPNPLTKSKERNSL